MTTIIESAENPSAARGDRENHCGPPEAGPRGTEPQSDGTGGGAAHGQGAPRYGGWGCGGQEGAARELFRVVWGGRLAGADAFRRFAQGLDREGVATLFGSGLLDHVVVNQAIRGDNGHLQ